MILFETAHMSEEPLGADVLVDVALNIVDTIASDLTQEIRDELAQLFSDFIDGRIDFNTCSAKLIEVIGKNDPVIKIRDIMELPMEPMPYVETEDSEDKTPGKNVRKKTRTWSATEDQRLLAGVYHYGSDNWKAVARFLGNGRNRAQCSQRWARGLNPKISKRNWTEEENKRLEELVRIHGDKSWTKISAIMGNRSDVQCRYHYKQILSGEIPMTLKSSSLTQSSQMFTLPHPKPEFERQILPPDDDGGEDEMISLGETRQNPGSKFLAASSPLFFPMESISALTDAHMRPRRKLFGATGGDPESLNLFLRNFV